MIITAQHAAEIPWHDCAGNYKFGYCLPGTRLFFIKYKLNYRNFIRYGIDSEILLKTRDHYAIRLVEFVERTYGQ